MKTCLLLWFSWQFDRNIPRLDELYAERFPCRHYLMPFYQGDHPHTIPIHESSLHFQNYFAQADKVLPQDADYYVVCGDDMILHPDINNDNLVDFVGCRDKAYVKYVNAVTDHSFAWHRFSEAMHFLDSYRAIPFHEMMPSREELLEIYRRHGIEITNIGLKNFKGAWEKKVSWERVKAGIKYLLADRKRYAEWPLVEGYCDFLVVPRKHWKKFVYYCGVLGAMNVWHDCSVVTALLLACDEVLQEKASPAFGVELWNQAVDDLYGKYQGDLQALLSDYAPNQIYTHPVKLSRWQ